MTYSKPIVFSSEMIKAILRGHKTQSRRIINLKGKPPVGEFVNILDNLGFPASEGFTWAGFGNPEDPVYYKAKYHIGDILYVAEGYQICEVPIGSTTAKGIYLADEKEFTVELTDEEWRKWAHRVRPYSRTPGRFMYKSLARIFLEITNIRVERIQQITEKDAIAEGCVAITSASTYKNEGSVTRAKWYFEKLWNKLHGREAWNRNDPVFVYEFRRK